MFYTPIVLFVLSFSFSLDIYPFDNVFVRCLWFSFWYFRNCCYSIRTLLSCRPTWNRVCESWGVRIVSVSSVDVSDTIASNLMKCIEERQLDLNWTETGAWITRARLYHSMVWCVRGTTAYATRRKIILGPMKKASQSTRKKNVYILLIDVSLDDLVISTRFGH